MLTTVGSLSPFAARAHGIALIVAPLLLLASTIAYTTEGGINDGVVGGTIGVWSVFALTFAFIGICRVLEPAIPRAATLLMLLAVVAFASGVAFNVQAIGLALFGPETEILEQVEGSDSIAIFAFLPWGLFVPVTFVLTGIALWRTRTVSPLTAALVALSGILFVASRPERINALAIIGDITTFAALAPIGWAMLTNVRASQPTTPAPRTAAPETATP